MPLICSNQVGAAYDLIHSNKNGFIIPSGDVDEFKFALIKLISQPTLIQEQSQYSLYLAQNLILKTPSKIWKNILQEILHFHKKY